MASIVKLPSEVVQVVPGATATVPVTIRNTGTVVDQFTIEILGEAAAWATVQPPTLSLFPGAEGQTVVTFAPPRLASVPAGTIVFGIRAASHEDPSGSTVEEGNLAVAAFADTFAELLPRTSTGSRAATHSLALDNRGNAAVNATVAGTDPDKLLDIGVRPPGLVVGPGAAAFASVRVAPRKRFWRGQPKTRPFKLQVETADGAPITLDGTMLQQAMLPGWLGRALLACLALLLIAALLWFGLLQPAIKTSAEQALADAGYTPHPAGATATPTATPAATPVSTSTSTPGPTPGPTLGPTPSSSPLSPFAGTPLNGRLIANGKSTTGPVASGKVLYITDLVFENPNGLSGSATLQLSKGLVIAYLQLENYRDLDYHYVTPIVIKSGDALTFTANCTPTLPCNPSVFYSGFTIP
ncbi:MAG: hypothetical protein ABSA21_11430 [Candidatus Limnocylindrales bacterium]|jgi:hypothetical protein